MAEWNADEKRVVDIIVEKLGCSEAQVVREAKFIEDLGADSLDSVEIIMELEQEFNIQIPDEVAEKMTNVGEVLDYINDKVSSGK